MKNEKGLIFACDLQNKSKALGIVSEIHEFVEAIKVNYPFILSEGIEIIEEINKFCPVIADFKIADVPHINKIISEKVFKNKGSGVICHSFLGKKSLLACKEKAKEFNKNIYSVVEMSHPGAEEFIHPQAKNLIDLSVEVGVDGVIAPGNDLKRLKEVNELLPKDLPILSPGIGAQGGKAVKAIKAGADFVIVGRKIYESSDPQRVSKELFNKIKDS